ncbi:MAG: chromate resistance protein ChrB domain-containing protein [Rhodoferax sp.]
MNHWLALVLSLPTENATIRQRAWRALKSSGAAVLRDGIYLMPERESCRATLDRLATDVIAGGGTALVLRIEEPQGADFPGLFDRGSDYAALLAELNQTQLALTAETAQETIKAARKLRKAYAAICEIDFFPGEPQRQAQAALRDLEQEAAHALSPDEPHAVTGEVPLLHAEQYQQRIWATRCRPWVDRLASAWLIRRFIDPKARFLWLVSPEDCPPEALGFDFDGAMFSHVGSQVSFEVLASSFRLKQPALTRLGQLIHYLDVGGVQPAEAAGVESVLAGLREAIADDDQLLTAASSVFDGLLAAFQQQQTAKGTRPDE